MLTWEPKANGTIRRAGGLRIFLERPWFRSGEGEKLAILVPTADAALPVNADPRFHGFSEWGTDPAFVSPTLQAMSRSTFNGQAYELLERAQPVGGKVAVDAYGFEVQFDENRRLWYCDIQLDPGQCYFPFVRLAVARMQPNAIPEAKLSGFAVTDWIQLLPRREMTYSKSTNTSGTTVNVTVRGTSARNAYPLKAEAPIRAAGGHGVRLQLQYCSKAALTDGEKDFGWKYIERRVETELTATASSSSSTEVTWTGALAIPSRALGDQRYVYRVLVTEYELYQADEADSKFPQTSNAPAGGRITFAAEIPL